MTIKLNIITPEGTIVDQMVDRVELPGSIGRFVVLKDHGEIVYGQDGRVHISSGFVEVADNHVLACVEL